MADRWDQNLGVISIGAQCGGPYDNGLSIMKVDLWKIFLEHCKDSCCPSIVHYAIALRIGGDFQDFQPEGIDGIRRNRRDRTIGVDIVIPKSAWQSRTGNNLRDYLAAQVHDALTCCVTRLKKDKEPIDEKKFYSALARSIAHFKSLTYV